MIREAGPDDQPVVEALLRRKTDHAMFPLANLRAHGLGDRDFASSHSHALRVWLIGDDSVVALTQGGMLLPLLAGSPDLSALRKAMAGLSVSGAVGPAAAVRPLLAALGLDRHPTQEDHDEPGFALDLDRLRVPDPAGARLRPLVPADLPLVAGWRETYLGEVMGSRGPKTRAKAEADIQSYLAHDSHRLLVQDCRPVAMTGFNATLPGIVQVGGVFTPPSLRGRGFARQAVALHLAEARAAGVSRAVLFAASTAAARAYQAIGFLPTISFALVQFSSDLRIAA